MSNQGSQSLLSITCAPFYWFCNVLGSMCGTFIGFSMFWTPFVQCLLVFPGAIPEDLKACPCTLSTYM